MATDPNAIQLSEEQRQLVAKLADEAGAPWPSVINDALASYGSHAPTVANESARESFYAAAKRLGLIACLEGGPKDLSTNPIHMEGFGSNESAQTFLVK
ncbi:MAG: hypothetical protein SGJ19_12840 [Planctomycetia bacterium]|nr:hypothetical protein [Planctomycetia bacterium]